jgi:hypothetical protein
LKALSQCGQIISFIRLISKKLGTFTIGVPKHIKHKIIDK